MSGKIAAFSMPGCRLRFLFTWLIYGQYYTSGRTRDYLFLVAVIVVLMVVTWFTMMSCPWIWHDVILYLCICVTVGFPFVYKCAEGGMVYMSSGMTYG